MAEMTEFTQKPWLPSYAGGVPAEISEPTQTLVQMMTASVKKYRRRPALDFFGATMSYGELGDQIARVASGLKKLGVTHGDRVALVMPNSPQHVVAFYAVLRLGAIVVEHNPLYTERELRHQFEDHGATVAIVWDKVAASVVGFPKDMKIRHVISVDVTRAMPLHVRTALRLPLPAARASRKALTTGSAVKGAIVWNELVESRRLARSHRGPSLTDTAVLQYTSGTTGAPKGAILTHANLRANAMQGEAWVPGLRAGREVFYGVLPMFHAYGLTLCLTFAMSMGARLVLFPKFDPELVLKVIKKRPATFLPAVPPIYEKLTAAAKEAGISLQGIEIAISGAMPLSASVVEPWEAETGGTLVEGYGLSETSPVLMANPVGPTRRAGTVGLPLPNTEVRVVDPENPTVDREAGAEGELIVRGPQVFSGYWKKPDETAAVFVPSSDDGADWYRTGDIVTIDDDGFVRIVDRIKEMIIVGGFKIAPSEVEDMLRSHPDIADIAVVGIPDADGSEHVVAAVVLAPGKKLDQESIRDFARANLTPYKVPRRVVAVDELPKSLIGKILRRKVRDQLIADQSK